MSAGECTPDEGADGVRGEAVAVEPMDPDVLGARIKRWDDEIRRVQAQFQLLKAERRALRTESRDWKIRSAAWEQAQKLVNEVAADVQHRAHTQLAQIATRCMRAVFGEDAYDLQIRMRERRGRTEADLILTRKGVVIGHAMDSVGGGVLDVAGFALRLACLLLRRPRLRRVMLLDEPFRFVSAQYHEAIAVMLKELSEELGVQIIMVTHIPALAAGKVVELGRGGIQD